MVIENFEYGKQYEITYTIPDNELADLSKLQTKLTNIHANIINSPTLKYIDSKLIGNEFNITVSLKSADPGAYLGAFPVVIVAVSVIAGILSVAGLNWVIKSVKEVSTPIIGVTKALTPVIFAILGFYVLNFVKEERRYRRNK